MTAQTGFQKENVIHKRTPNTIMIDGREVPLIKRMKAGVDTGAPRLPQRSKAGLVTSQVLLDEDFAGFAAGTQDSPDVNDLTGGTFSYIDPSFTRTPGWYGMFVYQAGGACYLEDPTRFNGAVLNTPLGDYSGDLTISCRIKPVDEVTFAHRFVISVCRGGYDNAMAALTDNGNGIESQLVVAYPGRWTDVQFTVRNYSADSDGFIQFSAYEKLLLDDIKIICNTSDFLAPPVIRSEVYHKDGFTVSWDPVERSGAYWMWLYEKRYTDDKEQTFTADFESGKPEGFDIPETSEVVPGTGVDGSAGLVLQYGDTIFTPYNFSRYKNVTCWAKLDAPSATSDELFNSQIIIGVRTEDGQWLEYGYMWADFYLDGAYIDFDELSGGQFGNLYYGVYIHLRGLPEDSRLILDDFVIPAGRPAELVPSSPDQEYGAPYAFTTDSKTASYTFSGLDPYTEYHYAIQSHDANFYSDKLFHKAFGVAAPDLSGTTGITADGYTANWQLSANATGYRVRNYAIHTAEADGEYVVLEDDFSGVDASVTDVTDPYNFEIVNGTDTWTSIDGYTRQDGWDVQLLALAQGWLGVYATSGPGMLRTPLLDLSNDDEFYIELSAIGIPNDAFYVEIGDKYWYFMFDENGSLQGKFTIPASVDDGHITFYSGATFMLDYIKISQNVRRGQDIRQWHSDKEVGGDETSCTLGGLRETGCGKFGYYVTALRDEYPDYAESVPTSMVVVDLETGTTGIDSAAVADGAVELARYSADGVLLLAPQPGLNILKMSDGTVRKVVVPGR